MSAADIIGGIAAALIVVVPTFGLIVWIWYLDERYWK